MPQQAMDALKASAPPNGEFKASDADVPENIGTKPGLQLIKDERSQIERIQAIDERLAKDHKREVAECKARRQTFIKAFFNRPQLPKPPDPLYEPVIPLWESYAKQYGANMLANPQGSGSEVGVSWANFVRAIDQWPGDLKALAKSVAIQRHPDRVEDLLDFVNGVLGLEKPDREMWTALHVYRISPLLPVKLRDAAADRKASMESVVSGLNLESATEKDLMTAIAGGSGELWDE